MSSFGLSTFQAHPGRFIGPTVVATLIQAVETGYLISQSIQFWSRADTESCWIRTLVGFVSIIAFFQSGAAFWSLWMMCVENFGNWVASLNPTWPQRAYSLITALMASPVQGFLIWRCWLLLGKNWIIIFPLICAVLASLITSIMVTVDVLKLDFVSPLTQSLVGKIPIDVPFVLSLVLPAFLDVAVTGILLTFLLRSRADIYSKRFRRVVTRLMIVAWEAAIPPCACAVTALVTYFTLVNVNYWDLTFQAILGKLYVISLFVTLNGRADIDAQRSHFPTFSNIISPTTGPSIRLSNTRPPEFVAARPSGTISFSSVHQTPTSDLETEGSQDDLERGRRWISRPPGGDLKT